MSQSTHDEAIPAALASKLAEFGIPTGSVRLDDYALQLGDVARAFAPETVVEVALSDRGRRDLDLEVAGRDWAVRCGVTTPPVVASGPGWIVSRRWPTGTTSGPDFVRAAVADAGRIATAPVEDWMIAGTGMWRAAARGRARRVARLVVGGMRIPEFLRARRVAAALPATRTAHGDFHPGNLLFDDDSRTLAVVDWTHTGPAPRHTDLLRLWGQLANDADAELVADAVLADTPPEERPGVGALWHWLALRQLAEQLTDPSGSDDPAYPSLLARRLTEARAFARRLGSPTVQGRPGATAIR
jgi:hypothetical protein